MNVAVIISMFTESGLHLNTICADKLKYIIIKCSNFLQTRLCRVTFDLVLAFSYI